MGSRFVAWLIWASPTQGVVWLKHILVPIPSVPVRIRFSSRQKTKNNRGLNNIGLYFFLWYDGSMAIKGSDSFQCLAVRLWAWPLYSMSKMTARAPYSREKVITSIFWGEGHRKRWNMREKRACASCLLRKFPRRCHHTFLLSFH